MKFTKNLTLITSIFLISNFSQAASEGSLGPDNPWTELTNCIHQTSVLGKQGQVIFQKAYKYAAVEEGLPCPPFNKSYEVSWNEIYVENISWGGVAVPQFDDVVADDDYVCDEGDEFARNGNMAEISECVGQVFVTSPTDHECRFGQGGGNPF